MTVSKSEKAAVLSMLESLENSTRTSWEYGDCNDWARYAREMKSTIKVSVFAILSMIKNAKEES